MTRRSLMEKSVYTFPVAVFLGKAGLPAFKRRAIRLLGDISEYVLSGMKYRLDGEMSPKAVRVCSSLSSMSDWSRWLSVSALIASRPFFSWRVGVEGGRAMAVVIFTVRKRWRRTLNTKV